MFKKSLQKNKMLFESRGGNSFLLSFDESTKTRYGVDFLQRIKTPKGLATVIGESESSLWFWVDGDEGISYWDNFSNINRDTEFTFVENTDYPLKLRNYLSKLFNEDFDTILQIKNMNDREVNAFNVLKSVDASLKTAEIFTAENLDAIFQHPEKLSVIVLLNLIFSAIPSRQEHLLSNLEIFNIIIKRPNIKETLETFSLLKKINLLNEKNIFSLLTNGNLPAHQQKILDQYLLVQTRIKENGALFGNKAANLMELNSLFEHEKYKLIHVQIPEIFPIDDATVQSHLDKYAPDWRNVWNEFVQIQKDKNTLQPNALSHLNSLYNLIQDAFKNHIFNSPILQSIPLPLDTLFMVRSTGDEDKIDLANPGGNKSVAAVNLDEKAFSKAMGTVIASYFSEKSLTQRLLSGDDITKTPFMPVLIQKMIGEKLDGNDPEQIVISGVMYAKDNMTRIEVAPGHGELIVNSKAPFDSYDVTAEEIVHAEIYNKQARLVPVEQEGKRKLDFKDNPKKLQENPSLPPAIAKEIAEVGQKIARHYGTAMDIEFVYEPSNNILYLVQTRPIQQILNQNLIPSSIAPEHWFKIKQNADIEKLKVTVVSPAGDATKIITKKNQLLFRKKIDKALRFYLDHPEIQNEIRAVVIEEDSPSTSHEAAQFNAMGLPVIQADKKSIKAWLKVTNPVLIIDPQRQHVINWTNRTKNQKNAEQELWNNQIITQGFFSSHLNLKKTLLPLDYLLAKPIEENIKKYLQNSDCKIDKKHIYKDLIECFEVIESAKPHAENKEAFEALQKAAEIFKTLGTSTQAHDDRLPHKKIFLHAIVSIAEIDHCLTNYSAFSDESVSKESQQRNLLDLVSKLKALIVNPGEKNLYSDSIMQIATQNKALIQIGDNNSITKDQQEYLQEFLKFNVLALRQDTRSQWTKFAYACSRSTVRRQMLSKIIMQIRQYHLESELINGLFMNYVNKAIKSKPTDPYDDVLVDMFSEITSTEKQLEKFHFNQNNKTIECWEKRIVEWGSFNKFDHLFEEFKHDVYPLIGKISIDDTMSELTKKVILMQAQMLTELIDKTIKSMKGSSEYTKDQTSVVIERFIKLLTPYHDFMQNWMDKIPESQYRIWAQKISKDDFYNYKSPMMNVIKDSFTAKTKKIMDLTELHPSGSISIASARIGTTASFQRQMVAKKEKLTLEDFFSLFHQNLLASLVVLRKKVEIPIERLPEPLQPLLQMLQKNTAIALLGFKHEFPKIILEYNIPLDNHSAKLILEYNTESKILNLHGNFFGMNWDRRMNFIGSIAKTEGILLNNKFLSEPIYNEENRALYFSWQFKDDQLNRLVKNINPIIEHYSELTERHLDHSDKIKMLKRNFDNESVDELLQSLSPKNFDLLNDEINSLNNDLIIELIKAFPELIVLCDKDPKLLEKIYLMMFEDITQIRFENLIKMIVKSKIDMNYSRYGQSFFEKFKNTLSDAALIQFLKSCHPDLSKQTCSFSSLDNVELINLLLEHGMPFSNFKFTFDSLASFIKDGKFKSILDKELKSWDKEKVLSWFESLTEIRRFSNPGVIELFHMIASKIGLNPIFESIILIYSWDIVSLKAFCSNYEINYAKQRNVLSNALVNSKYDIAEWLIEKGVPINIIDESAFDEAAKSQKGRDILMKCFDTFSPKQLTSHFYSKYYPESNSDNQKFYNELVGRYSHVLNFNFRQRKQLSLFEKLISLSDNNDLLKKIIENAQFDISKHPKAISLACNFRKMDIAMLLAQKKAKSFSITSNEINDILRASNVENCVFLVRDWPEKEFSRWIKDKGASLAIPILKELNQIRPCPQLQTLLNKATESKPEPKPKLDTLEDKFRFVFSKTPMAPLLNHLKIWDLLLETHVEFLDCPDSLNPEQENVLKDFFKKLVEPWRINMSSKFEDELVSHKAKLEIFLPQEQLEKLLTEYISQSKDIAKTKKESPLFSSVMNFFKLKPLEDDSVVHNRIEILKP